MIYRVGTNRVLIKIHSVVLTLAILLTAGCSQTDQTDDMPVELALQKALDKSIINSGVKGVSAAVVFSNGEIWKGASGISHEGFPVTPDMLFDIGSIEKNFQAALALKLVEERLMDLDAPIDKWFPPHADIDGKITIRQLLNMTSGLDKIVDDASSPWQIGYTNIDYDKVWSWEELYATYVAEPNFEPGAKCEYSTTNYIILKHIIEKITGAPQTAEFENRIMRPLELNQTLADFRKPIADTLQIVHGWCDIDTDGAVEDITDNSLAWLVSISPMLVYSTPGDMAKWIDALLRKKTVLKAETRQAMLDFRGPVMKEPMMHGYGLGMVDINLGALFPKWRDVKAYGHLGSQFGYSTFVAYFPELDISVALMFNRGCDHDTDRAIGAVAEAFFDVLFRRLGAEALGQITSVSDMEDVLMKSPGDIHLMCRIATMYRSQGDDDEALRTYEKVLTTDSGNEYGYRADALFWQASLEATLRQRPEKLVSFIAAHRDHRNIQFAYRNLADTYTRRNETHKAVAVYKEGADVFQEDALFMNSAAWWIFENKVESEYATAIEYAENAIAILPDDCAIWDTAARLYNVTGHHQKAIEASEKALSLAPKSRREEYRGYLDEVRKGK